MFPTFPIKGRLVLVTLIAINVTVLAAFGAWLLFAPSFGLFSPPNPMHARAWFGTMAGLMAVASIIGWLVIQLLLGGFVRSLAALGKTAAAIATERNYTLRAAKYAGGEIGNLVDHFNEILRYSQLRESELKREAMRDKAQLEFVFETVPIGIALSIEDGKGSVASRIINDAHLRICGFTREQVEDWENFVRISDPQERQQQLALTARMERGEIDQFTMEKRYLRFDGKVVWVVFSRQRRHYPDGSFSDLTTVTDVTSLKQVQDEVARERARLKFIFESVPVGIAWSSDREAGNRIVNGAYARISGVDDGHRTRADELVHADDREAWVNAERELGEGIIPEYAMELRFVRPDQSVCWTAMNVRTFRDALQGTTQKISTFVDITERKRMEMELHQAQRQLLEISRRAGMHEVAADVLHNIGNALNSVNVSAALLADSVRSSKISNVSKLGEMFANHATNLGEYLSSDPRGRKIPSYLVALGTDLNAEQQTFSQELLRMQDNIDRIKEVVAEQQKHEKVAGVMESVAVWEVVEAAINASMDDSRTGIEIVRRFASKPTVKTDRLKLLRILTTLIQNAAEACTPSGGQVTLEIIEQEGFVSVTIADNGVGIPIEDLTRIFAHGFAASYRSSLGLHSVALAAKEIGGALRVCSDPDVKGAAFQITLPFK